MKSSENPQLKKWVRYSLIACVILILSISTGTFHFHIEDQTAMAYMSKPTMAAVLPHTGNTAETSSAGVSSRLLPESSPQPNSSGTKDSGTSEKPMDPAVYQAMYPSLYAGPIASAAEKKNKTVYLTFDDGPSNLTIPLLDVLDQYHVKATFFVVGHTDRQSLKAMEEIVGRGHAIGVHSYTHQYRQIYATPAAFLVDFAEMHDLILKDTGFDTKIYRYAGGSINDYNHGTAKAIIAEMNRRGFVYYDWNVSSGDAERGSTARSIYRNTINGVHQHNDSVVLFHNTKYKSNTLAELPKIIEQLQKEGYSFEKLDPDIDNTPYIFKAPVQ
nr:polysaccharide deacetylase family protein [uncultured Caproiciproducens sp.]